MIELQEPSVEPMEIALLEKDVASEEQVPAAEKLE